MSKVSDQTLRELYAEYRSVYRVAKFLGLHGASVHERLQRLGVRMEGGGRRWTPEDDDRLRQDYRRYADLGRLEELGRQMGRTRQFLARKARECGLISQPNGKGRRKLDHAVWKYMDEKQATIIWNRFKASRLGLGAYCRKLKYDDLGFMRKMKEFFADEWEHVIEAKAPRRGWYRIGRELEYRIRDRLRCLGYFVLRSPASKSPLDLVAIRSQEVIFIQSKKGGTLEVREWNELYRLAQSVGAIAIMATGHPSGRGLSFYRLLGEKGGSRRAQPWASWTPRDFGPQQLFPGASQ